MEDLAGEPPRDLMVQAQVQGAGKPSGPEEVREGGHLCATCLRSPGFCLSGQGWTSWGSGQASVLGPRGRILGWGDGQNRPWVPVLPQTSWETLASWLPLTESQLLLLRKGAITVHPPQGCQRTPNWYCLFDSKEVSTWMHSIFVSCHCCYYSHPLSNFQNFLPAQSHTDELCPGLLWWTTSSGGPWGSLYTSIRTSGLRTVPLDTPAPVMGLFISEAFIGWSGMEWWPSGEVQWECWLARLLSSLRPFLLGRIWMDWGLYAVGFGAWDSNDPSCEVLSLVGPWGTPLRTWLSLLQRCGTLHVGRGQWSWFTMQLGQDEAPLWASVFPSKQWVESPWLPLPSWEKLRMQKLDSMPRGTQDELLIRLGDLVDLQGSRWAGSPTQLRVVSPHSRPLPELCVAGGGSCSLGKEWRLIKVVRA